MRLKSSGDKKPPSHKILIWYMYKHPYKACDLASSEDRGHMAANMKDFSYFRANVCVRAASFHAANKVFKLRWRLQR